MNPNFKKWLFSGLVFIITGAIILYIIALMTFYNADFMKYVLAFGISILAGYVVLKIVIKIDSANSPVFIFAVYSTIITSIVLFVTRTIVRLNDAMKILTNSIDRSSGLNVTSFFGTVHPFYSTLVVFLGLNAAYLYYYFKQPEKTWKEFIPHLCGIIVLVGVYLLEIALSVITKGGI